MKKKYLIIGGAGFIGSHLAEALFQKGNKVAVLDVKPFEVAGIKSYVADISQAKKVEAVFSQEKPDIVFHLAGAMHLRKSPKDPLFAKDLNFLARTHVILEVCKKYAAKKIIFVSSGGAIYENAPTVPTGETYAPSPSSLYGLSSLMTEKYVISYCNDNGIDFCIPRVSNAYGPRQWQTGFIPSIIEKLLQNESPVMHSKGFQTRDFIYIDDLVIALMLLAEKGENTIYNVGSGREVSLKDVFLVIQKTIGTAIKPTYKPLTTPQTRRSALNIKKVKKQFGWSPKTSIQAGIIKTIRWYKNHGYE